MSELEVRRARMDVEKSAAELEQALERLRSQVEDGIDTARELGEKVGEKVKDPSEIFDEFIDKAVRHVKSSGEELFHELRLAAEAEIQSLDQHPLSSWGTVWVSGLVVGLLIARRRRGEKGPSQQVAF